MFSGVSSAQVPVELVRRSSAAPGTKRGQHLPGDAPPPPHHHHLPPMQGFNLSLGVLNTGSGSPERAPGSRESWDGAVSVTGRLGQLMTRRDRLQMSNRLEAGSGSAGTQSLGGLSERRPLRITVGHRKGSLRRLVGRNPIHPG